MIPIDILKKDHRTVEALFAEYKKLGDAAHEHKKDLAGEIIDELTRHAELEETLFYPACKDAFKKEGDAMVEEAIAEHGVAKNLMSELETLEPQDEQFDAKVQVLCESIAHHIKEEEDELFPQAEKEMGKDRMTTLGEKMRAFKEKAGAE